MTDTKRERTVAWVIVGAVVLVVLLLFGIFTYGQGDRGYFSPDTLETKTQSEYLIPVVNIPVWRSGYDVHRYELVEFLVNEGYWSPTENSTPRWIVAFHWNEQWRDGETRLHTELARGEFWIEWTTEHPTMADAVWKRVIDILQDPTASPHTAGQMLRYASVSTDLKEFERLIGEEPSPED